jgi:hypothetical protein
MYLHNHHTYSKWKIKNGVLTCHATSQVSRILWWTFELTFLHVRSIFINTGVKIKNLDISSQMGFLFLEDIHECLNLFLKTVYKNYCPWRKQILFILWACTVLVEALYYKPKVTGLIHDVIGFFNWPNPSAFQITGHHYTDWAVSAQKKNLFHELQSKPLYEMNILGLIISKLMNVTS